MKNISTLKSKKNYIRVFMPSTTHGVSTEKAPWTILRVIQWTTQFLNEKGVDTPRLDAEVLLADLLSLTRVDLYLNYDRPLDERELAVYRERIKRRSTREPVAYITGHKEFYSLDFRVGPGVLIPRPETEHLVKEGIELVKSRWSEPSMPRLVDVGTGSGAVVVTLAKELPHATLWALDLMDKPLETAEANARHHQVANRIQFSQGDLLHPLLDSGLTFHLITANLPYIPTSAFSDMAPDVRDYEPVTSLDGGMDGLDLIRRLVVQSHRVLEPDGALLLEIWHDQRPVIEQLAEVAGFSSYRNILDYDGRDRIMVLDKKKEANEGVDG